MKNTDAGVTAFSKSFLSSQFLSKYIYLRIQMCVIG